MLRRRSSLWLGFVITACATVSCAAILGFERLEEGSPPAIDGGPEGSTNGEAGADGGSDTGPTNPACAELGIPPPTIDGGTGGAITITSALRLFDFGISEDGGAPVIPGFNLDLTCSDSLATGTCATDRLPAVFETYGKDRNANGLDNSGFALIDYMSKISADLGPATINEGIEEGKYGGVVQVYDWNGTPDDDSVRVEFFPAVGVRARDAGTTPNFARDDVWQLDERFQLAVNIDASKIKSDRAYVTGGRVVGFFQSVNLPITLASDIKPFDVLVRDAVFMATIEMPGDGGLVSLKDGVIAGRWRTSDFLGQVRTVYLESSNGIVDKTICDDDVLTQALYGAVKKEVCDGRDIRSDSQDNKALPCDAVSAAARIATYGVTTFGEWVPTPDGGTRCVNSKIPEGDDCK